MSQPGPTTRRHQSALSATLAGVLDALGRGSGGVTLAPTDRLDGKTVLVTGASRGLGRAIARGLGALGATVHVAVRSLADETVADVKAAGAPHAQAWPLDLERFASVDALVQQLVDAGVQLDVLVLNAGVVPRASRTTPDGLDVMLQVNALANVALVDGLIARGVLRPGTPAPRIVVVGSESHRSADPLDWTQLGAARTYGTGGVISEYGRSKLVLHTWVSELARRLDGPGPRIAVHHLCPGAIASDIAREAPAWVKPALNGVFRLFFQPPEVAAKPVLWLAAAADVGVPTGRYLHMRKTKDAADTATDPTAGAACWTATHALIAARQGA